MMMMPAIFTDKWLDDFFGFPVEKEFAPRGIHLSNRRMLQPMKTDIREEENAYLLDIDLPGFEKEEISVYSEDGYLTVSASHTEDTEDHSNDRYLRRERCSGSCSRRFYLGDNILEDEIEARFENGILKLQIPKQTVIPENGRKVISVQ